MERLSKQKSTSIRDVMQDALRGEIRVNHTGQWRIEASDGQWVQGNGELVQQQFEYSLTPTNEATLLAAIEAERA